MSVLCRVTYPFSVLLPHSVSFCFAPARSPQELLQNNGFETNNGVNLFNFWGTANLAGDPGSFFAQSGTGTYINGYSVAAPPEGTFAAMTDQEDEGSHVIYQDFVVPAVVSSATLSFQYTLLNKNDDYVTANSLDYTGDPMQQARVDILTTTADVFSVAPGDVLQNVFQTQSGDPLDPGVYLSSSTDVTGLLQAHAGETLRLRFAEADNRSNLVFGVDNVHLNVGGVAAPEPGSLALLGMAALPLVGIVHRRKA